VTAPRQHALTRRGGSQRTGASAASGNALSAPRTIANLTAQSGATLASGAIIREITDLPKRHPATYLLIS
jgi:hypothetical protein